MTGKRCLWLILGCLGWFVGLAQAQDTASACPPVAGGAPSEAWMARSPARTPLLQQDNPGLPVATHGVCTYQVPGIAPVAEVCLTRAERRAARRAAQVP